MTRWFRSTAAPRDPAWHQWHTGQIAICGARAHPSMPWVDHIAGRHTVTCADCED